MATIPVWEPATLVPIAPLQSCEESRGCLKKTPTLWNFLVWTMCHFCNIFFFEIQICLCDLTVVFENFLGFPSALSELLWECLRTPVQSNEIITLVVFFGLQPLFSYHRWMLKTLGKQFITSPNRQDTTCGILFWQPFAWYTLQKEPDPWVSLAFHLS